MESQAAVNLLSCFVWMPSRGQPLSRLVPRSLPGPKYRWAGGLLGSRVESKPKKRPRFFVEDCAIELDLHRLTSRVDSRLCGCECHRVAGTSVLQARCSGALTYRFASCSCVAVSSCSRLPVLVSCNVQVLFRFAHALVALSACTCTRHVSALPHCAAHWVPCTMTDDTTHE